MTAPRQVGRLPQPDRPDVETSSAAYARRFSGAVGSWFLERQARITQDLLVDLPPATRVLEVGGGHGQLTPTLAASGYRVTVLGSTPECRARLASLEIEGTWQFVAGDLVRLPFPDRSFAAVLAFRLMAHVPAWRDLVAELCRVAERRVILEYPSTRSVNGLAGGLFGLKRKVEGDTRPYLVFSPRVVSQALSERGFGDQVTRAQYFLPMALHRMHQSRQLGTMLEGLPAALGLTSGFGSPVIARADRTRGT